MACVMSVSSLHAAAAFVSQAQLAANDSVDWAQLGPAGTYFTNYFTATSAAGATVNGSSALFGYNSVQTVCGNPPNSTCTFPSGPGFNPGDSLVVTSYFTFNGNGPLTFDFANPVLGAGAYIASEATGVYTAELQAYDGTTLLLTQTVVSDANSDPVFLGALDTTQDITSEVFSLISVDPNGGADVNNFAVDTLFLNTTGATATPEPSTLGLMLLATGILVLRLKSLTVARASIAGRSLRAKS